MNSCVLTILSRLLNESINATLSIVPLRRHSGHIVPAHSLDYVHHCLGLICIWRYHTGEKVVAGVVTELRSCGGVAHLWYLHTETD